MSLEIELSQKLFDALLQEKEIAMRLFQVTIERDEANKRIILLHETCLPECYERMKDKRCGTVPEGWKPK